MTTTPLPWHATDKGPYTSEKFKEMIDHINAPRLGLTRPIAEAALIRAVEMFGIAPMPEDGPCLCNCAIGSHPPVEVPQMAPSATVTYGKRGGCLDCSCPFYTPATLDVLMARQGEELERYRKHSVAVGKLGQELAEKLAAERDEARAVADALVAKLNTPGSPVFSRRLLDPPAGQRWETDLEVWNRTRSILPATWPGWRPTATASREVDENGARVSINSDPDPVTGAFMPDGPAPRRIFWIVWSPEIVGRHPEQFDTEAQAIEEAQRLAKEERDAEVFVLRAEAMAHYPKEPRHTFVRLR